MAADLAHDFLDDPFVSSLTEPVHASAAPSALAMAVGDSGQITSVDTQRDIAKPNHSPVFFHDDSWWGVFRAESDGDWWLWKRDNDASWSKTSLRLATSGSDRPDVIVDASTDRMYSFFSNSSSPSVYSATYDGASWSIDPQVNGVAVPGMDVTPDESVLALASRWQTPTLFAFRYDNASVAVNWSTDHGRSWQSSATSIASGSQGLSQNRGLVDATEFSWNDGSGSRNYVAVAYGENSQGQFGLLTLREGASAGNPNNWDHVVLPAPADGAGSDDHVSITRDGSTTNNRLYIVGKTEGGSSGAAPHVLYVRDNNPAGTVSSTDFDGGRSRPAAVYDTTNDELYVITSNASGGRVEYRKSPAPEIDFGPVEVLLDNGGDDFINGGSSHAPINAASGLLYVAGNKSDNNIWENHFDLGPNIPTPGIAVSPTNGLVTSEDGAAAVFGVSLEAAPSAPVMVSITSDDNSEGTVSVSSLLFSSINWNIPQPVTVTGAEDGEVDGDTGYSISVGPATGAAEYIGLFGPTVQITNLDNDVPPPTPGVTVSPTNGLTTTEAGAVAQFTVVLDAQPSADVTISLSSSDTTEGTIDNSQLIFSPLDWDQPRPVTVTGVDDTDQDGDVAYTIQLGPAAGASEYVGIDPADPAVVNLDDDQPTPSANLFFSVEDDATIGQGLSVATQDIILDDGSQFAMFFDGSDVGLDGYTLGAFHVLSANEILMSFDNDEFVPGVGTVSSADIVKFTATQLGDTTAGAFELYFNAAAVGVYSHEVDAMTQLPDGRILFSFRSSFSVDGASGKDEDLVAFTPTSLGANTAGAWELYFDGSDVGLSDGGAEDIDSVAVGPDGEIYLSTPGDFVVPGISGAQNDVFVFQPATLGKTTSGSYLPTLKFNGASRGLAGLDIKGIDVPSIPPTPNDPPQAADDSVATNEDQSLTIDVLAGDSDPNGNSLSVTALDATATSGDVTINPDDTVDYTPPTDFNGVDTFIYTIGDGHGGVDSATVTVTINSVNDAPSFSLSAEPNQAVTPDAGPQSVAGFATGVSAGPSDEAAQALQFIVSTDNDGLFTAPPAIDPVSGTLTYTPDATMTGSVVVTVQLTDDGGAANGGQDTSSPPRQFTITISLAAAPPEATDDFAVTDEDQAVTLDVLSNDSDPNNDPLGVDSVDTTTTLGVVTINPDDTVTYTPAADFHGADTFGYTVSDGAGGFDTATVTVTVDPVNDPPTVANPIADVNVIQDAADTQLDLSATFTDVDIAGGDALGLSVFANSNATLVGASLAGDLLTLSYQPGGIGVADLTIRATDLAGATADAMFRVTVNPEAGSSDLIYFAVEDPGVIGSLVVGPEDIIAYDGAAFRLLLDGSDIGLAGVEIDALDVISPTEILLSFASDGSHPDFGSFADEDVILLTATQLGNDTAGTLAIYFDGSDVDLASNDVDAVSLLSDGRLLLSTTSSYDVEGSGGKDEDLFAFLPSSTGEVTSGLFMDYFDGGDVGLADSGAEDTDGASVAPDGMIYLSVRGDYSVPGASGANNDIFVFHPATLGDDTTGAYDASPYFSGGAAGLGSLDIKAFDVPDTSAAPASASSPPSKLVYSASDATGAGGLSDFSASQQSAAASSISRFGSMERALPATQATPILGEAVSPAGEATSLIPPSDSPRALSSRTDSSSFESSPGVSWRKDLREEVLDALAKARRDRTESDLAAVDDFFARNMA